MKLEQSFTVEAPAGRVWDALVDVQRVAPCLPGAEVTSVEADGTYHGTFTVKLGPTTAAYNGTLRMEELDEAAHTAVMSARGTDKRGQGGASATIRSTVGAHGEGTKVDVVTDFTITGRLARFGRGGMIEDVSRRLMREFAACLQATIAATPPTAAVATPAAASTAAAPAEPTAPAEPAAPAPAGPAAQAPPPAGPATQPSAPAKPLNALALLLGVIWDRIKRLVARLRGRRPPS
jgi:carbon monoxide dehydrogenase subunit G